MARVTKKRKRKIFLKLFFLCLFTPLLSCLAIDAYVVGSTMSHMTSTDDAPESASIVVLGASVVNGKPSPMLAERLDTAITLYQNHRAEKLILSGFNDHGYYNEVEAMRHYVVDKGIPPIDIVIDDRGRNTRASFEALAEENPGPLLIVTQRYHLHRALYLARSEGLSAYGVPSDRTKWGNGDHHLQREHLARIKDFIENHADSIPEPFYAWGQNIRHRIENNLFPRA